MITTLYIIDLLSINGTEGVATGLGLARDLGGMELLLLDDKLFLALWELVEEVELS